MNDGPINHSLQLKYLISCFFFFFLRIFQPKDFFSFAQDLLFLIVRLQGKVVFPPIFRLRVALFNIHWNENKLCIQNLMAVLLKKLNTFTQPCNKLSAVFPIAFSQIFLTD